MPARASNFSILLTCGSLSEMKVAVHERSCITHVPDILHLKGYDISKNYVLQLFVSLV